MENTELQNEIEKGVESGIKSATGGPAWLLPASILVASLLIAGSVIYSTGVKNIQPAQQQAKVDAVPQLVAPKINSNDVVLGKDSAPVTIIEFGDFQCPYCAKFYKETGTLIQKDYIDSGKVKMVFKPLAILGNESTNSAMALLCSKDQNKFWEFHDVIYNIEYTELENYLAGKGPNSENNGNLNRELFKKTATTLKMNTSDFLICYDSKKYQKVLSDNLKEAQAAMDSVSTPTLFINGKLIKGAQPYSVFSTVINGILK